MYTIETFIFVDTTGPNSATPLGQISETTALNIWNHWAQFLKPLHQISETTGPYIWNQWSKFLKWLGQISETTGLDFWNQWTKFLKPMGQISETTGPIWTNLVWIIFLYSHVIQTCNSYLIIYNDSNYFGFLIFFQIFIYCIFVDVPLEHERSDRCWREVY